MDRVMVRMAVVLIVLGLFPLPWIVHNPGLVTVDFLGIAASTALVILSLLKQKLFG